jgi:anti-anti-sigma factor
MPVKMTTMGIDLALIEVRGALMSQPEIDNLRTTIIGVINKHYKKLIIDFSGCDYMNSPAIGVLVGAHASFANRKWALCFCGVNNNLFAILAVARLTHVFRIVETREEALRVVA